MKNNFILNLKNENIVNKVHSRYFHGVFLFLFEEVCFLHL